MQMRSILTGLLAAQVVLAASLFVYNHNQRDGAAATPLLGFSTADVDRIIIGDSANSTTLKRDGANWQLSELSALPANDARIGTLLDNLSKLKTQWPVASSATGRERFEVTEEKFQRHLSLYQGETLLGDYYFGTAPGFRQTHARRAGDDEVYALAFNNFDLPADDNDWLQKDLLHVDGITAIRGQDFEMVQQDGNWQLTPQSGVVEMELDAEKVKAMVSALEKLTVLRVAEAAPAGESHTLSVTTADGSKDFLFTKVESQYFVKRNDREQVFTISASDYDKLGAITRSNLLKPLPEPSATESQQAGDATQAGPALAPSSGT